MIHVRAKVLGVLVAALAISVFAISPVIGSAAQNDFAVSTLAEQGCEANNVCGYTLPQFEGERFQIPCSSSGNIEPLHNFRSARNRCANKINHIANSGGSVCMNPGGDRPNPGTFAVFTLPNNFGPPFC
jgi:hypothetical protein